MNDTQDPCPGFHVGHDHTTCMALRIQQRRQRPQEPTCGGCNGALEGDGWAKTCTGCGGVNGDAPSRDAVKAHGINLDDFRGASTDTTRYFDVTYPHADGRVRVHGWYDANGGNVVQFG